MDLLAALRLIFFIFSVWFLIILPCVSASMVRLMDGQVPQEGRVEVLYNKQWGTVCDHHWSLSEAQVVCREMGYIGADLALYAAAYGKGSGPIWLDNVFCDGDEENLFECAHSTVGMHDCSHFDDASVMCTSTGSLRFSDTSSTHEGLVEVLVSASSKESSSVWGSICGDTWTSAAGEVACRQLGFSGYLNSSWSSPQSEDRVDFWNSSTNSNGTLLSSFDCDGDERRLDTCPGAVWSSGDACSERRSIYLQCDPTVVRLVDGSGAHEGRVEVFHGSTWGTVCDDKWDLNDADVVCRELGYFYGAIEATRNSEFGMAEGPILLDDVGCSGSERSIFDCTHNGFSQDNCNHLTDAGAVCMRVDKQVRLLGGSSSYEGVVQMWFSHEWATICDYGEEWGAEEREVVCRQLGYQVDDDYTTDPVYINEVNSNNILKTDFTCRGYEKQLLPGCMVSYYTSSECSPDNVAQSKCAQPKDFDVRLQNSANAGQGLLEIYRGGYWGTVNDLDDDHGEVICRHLGYESVMEIYDDPMFGIGHSTIWSTRAIECEGDEETLGECHGDLSGSSDLEHSRDVSMMCRPYESIGYIGARLVGRSYDPPSRGRVEVSYGQELWGSISVCSQFDFGLVEAQVICRQLGFSDAYVKILPAEGFEYAQTYTPAALNRLNCDSNDRNLRECHYGPWGDYAGNECPHTVGTDVGIDCYYYRDNPTEPVDDGSLSIPVWEIILITLMALMIFFILIVMAVYQQSRKQRNSASPIHGASSSDHTNASNPTYEMAEPPPQYRPPTPPPTEAPPSYEWVLDPRCKENDVDAAPRIEDYCSDSHTSRERGHCAVMPRGYFQRTDTTEV